MTLVMGKISWSEFGAAQQFNSIIIIRLAEFLIRLLFAAFFSFFFFCSLIFHFLYVIYFFIQFFRISLIPKVQPNEAFVLDFLIRLWHYSEYFYGFFVAAATSGVVVVVVVVVVLLLNLFKYDNKYDDNNWNLQ